MSMELKLDVQKELAPDFPASLDDVRAPQYGRYLDDFEPGQVFQHPRGYTFDRAEMLDFARTFMQANPIFLNARYAKDHGFEDVPASPQHVFNVVLSLGVQNDSEKAIANLGYYNAQFLRPVYPDDTIRSLTYVADRRDRGPGKPGIPHIRTLGVNQRGEVVLQYERKIMVAPRGDGPPTEPAPPGPRPDFPWVERPVVSLPFHGRPYPTDLTGAGSYFEDFRPGQIIVHVNGRTITDEHVFWTYKVGNTHPLHYDRLYSQRQQGPMSGEPIVYGGLVFAWLEGLASRDVTENALWELGFTEGYHTQPAFAGDTVSALSRVLDVRPAPDPYGAHCGIVTFQLVGVKNLAATDALERFGADLFLKENDKKAAGKEKIPEKIFEIERRVLVKRKL